MATTRTLPDGPPAKPNPAEPPVFTQSKCPNCGHEPAVVFPLVVDGQAAAERTRLVCLECCPEARDRHGLAGDG